MKYEPIESLDSNLIWFFEKVCDDIEQNSLGLLGYPIMLNSFCINKMQYINYLQQHPFGVQSQV